MVKFKSFLEKPFLRSNLSETVDKDIQKLSCPTYFFISHFSKWKTHFFISCRHAADDGWRKTKCRIEHIIIPSCRGGKVTNDVRFILFQIRYYIKSGKVKNNFCFRKCRFRSHMNAQVYGNLTEFVRLTMSEIPMMNVEFESPGILVDFNSSKL